MASTFSLFRDRPNVVVGFAGKHSPVEASHYFEVRPANDPYNASAAIETIQFQDGALSEDHIDGVHNEDLLLMVRDRLLDFQRSSFACRENAVAITKIEEAMMWLAKRTEDRKLRGVEGKHEK